MTRAGLCLLALALSCVTIRTPHGIAATLDRCLAEQAPRLRAQGERPLAWQCACVVDAQRACVRAGRPENCAFDGWNVADRLDRWPVADHDAWTVAVCRQQLATEETRAP